MNLSYEAQPAQYQQSKALSLKSLINYVLARNYKLSYSSSINIWACTLLYIIRQLQIIVLISIPQTDPMLDTLPNIKQLFMIANLSVFQFNNKQDISISLYVSVGLFTVQIVALLFLLLPIQNKQINNVASKILITINTILVIPTILNFTKLLMKVQHNSAQQIVYHYVSLSLSFIAFVIALVNIVLYINFHFCYSIKQITKNSLVRLPSSLVKEIGWLVLALLRWPAIKFSYPTLFSFFIILCFVQGCHQAKRYTIQFEYFDSKICRNLGMMSLFNITLSLAMFCCYFQIQLFKISLTSFIIAFYLFFLNFFITFRKFWIKRIIIDDNTTNQVSQLTYVSTFIVFQIDRNDKKNQTYISSLLKNHCNNCQQLACCCKNRNKIYDPSRNEKGISEIQPHLDLVFVKHFFLKMIEDSIIEFPKSLRIKMLLGLYYFQFLQLTPQVIKQIKFFNKKVVADKLSIQQKFSLYCLEQQFTKFVGKNNLEKGNKQIQKIKKFDELLNSLIQKIVSVTQNFRYFWQTLQSRIQIENKEKGKINPKFLSVISLKTIKLMEQIQKIYDQMKKINPSSAYLKQIMFFYAKDIVIDMDLFIRVKEDLKMENLVHIKKDNKKNIINIYRSETANFVISDPTNIRWISNNAKLIFGYQRTSNLLKGGINNLMPNYFAKNHDAFFKQFLQTGFCQKMNSTKTIWCKKQNDVCFRANIYIKIMVNFASQTQKDIQYYTSIQGTRQGEIVCGPDGQIYGCDQKLKNLFKCPLNKIQKFNPNIQIFFPSLFLQFGSYFYKHFESNKKINEMSCSGYIPSKMTDFLQNFSKQKLNFLTKNKNNKNISMNQIYGLFLQIKMQQLNSVSRGRYVTVYFQIQKINLLHREMTIFKIIKIQVDTIQKYFDEFQKIIKKLVSLRQKQGTKSQNLTGLQKKYEKHSSNLFDFWLNPRKLKNLNSKKTNSQINQISRKDSIQRRKQRAMNQLAQIKCQRVKENIEKMKKLLYKNKIFSAGTFKILTRQERHSEDFIIEDQQQLQYARLFKQQKTKTGFNVLTLNKNVVFHEQDNISQQQLLDESRKSQAVNKFQTIQNDNKVQQGISFQESTTSSAAFISLSTKIKILKQKLKQIKPKTFLIAITIIFILVLFSGVILNGINIIESFTTFNSNETSQNEIYTSFKLIESLLGLKIIESSLYWQQLLKNNNTTLFQSGLQNQSLLNSHWIFNQSSIQSAKLMFQSIALEQLSVIVQKNHHLTDDEIKSGYSYQNTFNNTQGIKIDMLSQITLNDFFFKQFAEIDIEIQQNVTHQIKDVTQRVLEDAVGYVHVIHILYSIVQNTYQNSQQGGTIILYLLPAAFIIKILLLILVRVSSFHINKTCKLMSQIGPNQRHKYAKLYDRLGQKVGQLLTLTNMSEKYSKKKKSMFNQSQQNPQHTNNQKNKLSAVKILCILIWLLFTIIYASVLISYGVQSYFSSYFNYQKYLIDGLLVTQMKLNYRLMIMQNQLINSNDLSQYYDQIDSFGDKNGPQGLFINIFNSEKFNNQIKQTIKQYCTTNMCETLQPSNMFNQNQINKLDMQKVELLQKLPQICQSTNNNIFKQAGLLQSYSYIFQNIAYLNKQAYQNWSQLALASLTQTSLVSTLLTINMMQELSANIHKEYLFYLKLKLIFIGLYLFGMIIAILIWRYVYHQVAKMNSMHNRYLLMLPFDLLNQNPYMRQFLKDQLQFKYNLY